MKSIYETLEKVRASGSTLDKVAILQLEETPELKQALLYAYDPHKTYGVKKISIPRQKLDFGEQKWETVLVTLDALDRRQYTGNAAKGVLTWLLERIAPEEQILLYNILQRDLRAGINVSLINQAFPNLIPTFDVMLAKPVDWARVQFPCLSSVKLDGVRGIYKEGHMYTRSGKKLVGLDHITKALDKAPSLDGEIIVPGKNFDRGSGAIRSLSNTPRALFCVFDIVNSPLSFPARLSKIEEFNTLPIKAVPHRIVNSKEEALDHYYACRKAGFEGTVIKPMDYVYQGKRSYDWMKLKAIETIDLPVVGYYEGAGKYAGVLGGFTFELDSRHIHVGTGFSDSDRASYWAKREDFIGRIGEVFYQEKTADGSLRHPRFMRWRDDKCLDR